MLNKIFSFLVLGLFIITHFSYVTANTYGNFPITEKSYSGSKKNSTSYTGQMARHVLHNSLKKLAGQGNGLPNPKLKAQMLS